MTTRQLLAIGSLSVVVGLACPTDRPAAAPSPTPDGRPVPILMYHVVADPPRGAPYPLLYVAREELQQQVAWLQRAGYEAVTLGRVFDAWHGHATLPARPIVLSFDDGYRSHVTAALPILAARRWPGVLDLDLSNLEPSWSVRPRGVRRLIAAGWEIDAHSMTHADLPSQSAAGLTYEVAGSRAEIRRRFGVTPRFFCYPSGRYDARVVAAVQAAAYDGATTTEPGLARPATPFTLARIRIDRGDGARGLADKLAALGLPTSRARHGGSASRP